MFTQLLALISAIVYVRAASGPLPDTPTGGQQVGGKCTIQWTADPSGLWKTMYIELMAGPNVPMQHLTTVATVDGTDPNNTTLTWTCPDVSPNAPVFFYQFSSPFAPLDATAWSSRFTIEGADGTSDPAPTSTQPGGAPTPWGSATLGSNVVALPAPTDAGSKAGGASVGTNSTSSESGASSPSGSGSGTASGSTPVATASGSTPSASGSGGPLGVSTQSQVSAGTKSAAGTGASTGAGTGTSTASAGATSPSNGAVAVRGAPLYALGAVAAFAVLAL